MILRTSRAKIARKIRKSEALSGQRGLRARKVNCLLTSTLLPLDDLFCISHARKPRCPRLFLRCLAGGYLNNPIIKSGVRE